MRLEPIGSGPPIRRALYTEGADALAGGRPSWGNSSGTNSSVKSENEWQAAFFFRPVAGFVFRQCQSAL